jgi:metallophosphoesterase (TIGR00282 family)
MRLLFVGDVVGPPGVTFLLKALPVLIVREQLDVVVANVENAANGSGLTASIYRRLRDAGVDLMTLGDHIYKKAVIIPTLQQEPRLCKPANFPPEAPGADHCLATARDGTVVAVLSVLGRTYMRPVDCPFHAVDRVLASLGDKARVVIVDVHAEATADKYLLGHYLKGRVTAVVGTHTHVPTADEQVLPGGTAFISDVGMTGPYESILGRRIDRVLPTTISFVPSAFDVADRDPRVAGVVIDLDSSTGKAQSIRRLMLDEAGLARMQQAGQASGTGAT